ncbi:MAG: GHMP kinase [Methanocalculaceae archaeon]|jgi:beta-RFAP synthase|nr:GHMP kinase [Methanocalculaceae archaeon]
MTIMKIRGGDLDLVEYEFCSFYPGECLHIDDIIVSHEPHSAGNTITVRVPARIHLSVLDMNRFSPGTPGGGGFGFAIQIYCEATVTCTPGAVVVDSPRMHLIEHLVAAFKAVTGYSGGFTVKTVDYGKEHVGLGSTCTIATAVVTAMNEATCCPLSLESVRMLIGHNYVEETEEEGKVAFGFETGVGSAASIYGGMTIVGDQLIRVYNHPFAESRNVFVVIPHTHDIDANAGHEEFTLLMNRARILDYRDRELKAYLLMMDLIPSLARGNLKEMGDIMEEIEFRGSKRAEVQHHTFFLYQYMNSLRHAGLEFVAMSSVGPSVCIVTEKSAAEVQLILDPLSLEIAVATKVDNKGVVVTKT